MADYDFIKDLLGRVRELPIVGARLFEFPTIGLMIAAIASVYSGGLTWNFPLVFPVLLCAAVAFWALLLRLPVDSEIDTVTVAVAHKTLALPPCGFLVTGVFLYSFGNPEAIESTCLTESLSTCISKGTWMLYTFVMLCAAQLTLAFVFLTRHPRRWVSRPHPVRLALANTFFAAAVTACIIQQPTFFGREEYGKFIMNTLQPVPLSNFAVLTSVFLALWALGLVLYTCIVFRSQRDA